MPAEYSFDVDPERGIVRITLSGFCEVEDVPVYFEARRRARASAGRPPCQVLTLTDLRGLKIQNQAVVEAFRQLEVDPSERSRRLAYVVAPSLVRAQLMRAVTGKNDFRCFETAEDAEAWLFEDEQPARVSGRGSWAAASAERPSPRF